MRIRALLADDHTIFLDGLRAALEQHGDIDIVETVRDGREAVRVACALQPDIVIMDLAMPQLNGLEATRQIMAAHPAVKVLCLSMYTDKRFVLGALEAGAAGYVLKDSAMEELFQAIHTVLRHQRYLNPRLTGLVVDAYTAARLAPPAGPHPLLTAREREVLQLIAEGRTTKEIAASLGVSIKTISTHRGHLMAKLDLHSIAALTKYAIREGIISTDA